MDTDLKKVEKKKWISLFRWLNCLSFMVLFLLIGCTNHEGQQSGFNATVSQKDQALRKFLNIISLEGDITVPRGVGAVRPIVICFKDDNAVKAIVGGAIGFPKLEKPQNVNIQVLIQKDKTQNILLDSKIIMTGFFASTLSDLSSINNYLEEIIFKNTTYGYGSKNQSYSSNSDTLGEKRKKAYESLNVYSEIYAQKGQNQYGEVVGENINIIFGVQFADNINDFKPMNEAEQNQLFKELEL